MNLSLTPELEKFIQSKIESGMYSNSSEVVRDALRHMDEHDRWKDLQEFLAPRIAAAKSGDIINQSFDSIIDEAKKK
jgi:antitoxin ParD1/3/4